MDVKPRRVQTQKAIKSGAPELHEMVRNGEMTHAQAAKQAFPRPKDPPQYPYSDSFIEWLEDISKRLTPVR
jgi:hypothetical protein